MRTANHPFATVQDIPELSTASTRTAANTAAMATGAKLYGERRLPMSAPCSPGTPAGADSPFSPPPASSPRASPSLRSRSLTLEFYTRLKVVHEVTRSVAPLVHAPPHDGETVHAPGPSEGIVRFVRIFEALPGLTWHAVEWSTLSALMLKTLRPDLDLTIAPFESWVREHGCAAERLGLVVSNPPYGIRGASIAEDPDRA
jgi:hypothetical protein